MRLFPPPPPPPPACRLHHGILPPVESLLPPFKSREAAAFPLLSDWIVFSLSLVSFYSSVVVFLPSSVPSMLWAFPLSSVLRFFPPLLSRDFPFFFQLSTLICPLPLPFSFVVSFLLFSGVHTALFNQEISGKHVLQSTPPPPSRIFPPFPSFCWFIDQPLLSFFRHPLFFSSHDGSHSFFSPQLPQ